MDLRNKGTLKSLFVPGGILLLAAVILLSGGFLSISAAAVDFYYYRFSLQESCWPGASIPAASSLR